jgi:hypothetical protein
MKIIKLSHSIFDYSFLRQTPGGLGKWGEFQFDDSKVQEIFECDYYVVFNNIPNMERICCPKGNSILVTAEPPAILDYPKNYLKQFDYIISVQSHIKHPSLFIQQTALPWHVGLKKEDSLIHKVNKCDITYDSLKAIKEPSKQKLASTIISNKSFTTGHQKRRAFLDAIKANFNNTIDIYGAGINSVADKWDAIAPYKYHIAIENSSVDHYFTEKLTDAYLGFSFPIYYGCPNINQYFDKDSYKLIDIDNIDDSINRIGSILESDTFENNYQSILKARDLVLDTYNLFPSIVTFIEDNFKNTVQKKETNIFYPLSHFKNRRNRFLIYSRYFYNKIFKQ